MSARHVERINRSGRRGTVRDTLPAAEPCVGRDLWGTWQGPAEPLQNDPRPLPPEHRVPERRVGSQGRDTAFCGMRRGGGTLKGRWVRR